MSVSRSFVRWAGFVAVILVLSACASGAADNQAATPPHPPLLTAPASTRPSGDAAGHLVAAQAALDKRDFATAEREFRDAIALDPRSAKAQLGLGNVYVRESRLAEAETAYRAALALDPSLAAGQANLGVVYYQMGQLPQAADALNAALKLEPNDGQNLYLLAAVRLQQNDLPAAEKLLLQAREAKPDLPEVYYGLGVLYRLKNQKQDAIAAFQKFLSIGPGQDPSAMDYAQAELKSLQGQ
jgi:tetratricopeptide (TPR) repeat protein